MRISCSFFALWYQYVALAAAAHGADQTGFSISSIMRAEAVVAYLQVTLHQRNAGFAVFKTISTA